MAPDTHHWADLKQALLSTRKALISSQKAAGKYHHLFCFLKELRPCLDFSVSLVESQGGGSKKSGVVSLRMSGAELLEVKNLGTADDGLSEGLSTQWQTHKAAYPLG